MDDSSVLGAIIVACVLAVPVCVLFALRADRIQGEEEAKHFLDTVDDEENTY